MHLTVPLLVSAAVFAALLATVVQLPVVGQILVPVFLVQAGATLVHEVATRRRPRVVVRSTR
jgi:hypothetical protein